MQSERSTSYPLVHTVFPVLVFFLAAIFSGVLEKLPILAGLHILTIVGGAALIVVAISGRLQDVAKHPISKTLMWFTVWFIFCIPCASWRGGSFAVLQNIWLKAALSYVLVAGCILTIEQSKTIFKTMGYSVGVLATITLALGGTDNTGRLGLLNTRYENANDLGWTLILGLSFLTFLFSRGNGLQRVFAIALSVPILLALVKTGSRASMVGFGVLAIFGFLQAPRAMKIRLGLIVPVVLAVLVFVTPKELRMRYTTIFGQRSAAMEAGGYLTEEQRLQETAKESADQRWRLLKDSAYLTLTNPLVGVGPGDFAVAQEHLALDRGEMRGAWRVTHNTYTQISSEMGIPGLVMFLALFVRCLKSLNAIIRTRYSGSDGQDLRAMAKSLRATLVMLLTVAFFGSFGYDTNIPVLAGMACALSLIAQRQSKLLNASRQASSALAVPPEPALEPAWTPTTM